MTKSRKTNCSNFEKKILNYIVSKIEEISFRLCFRKVVRRKRRRNEKEGDQRIAHLYTVFCTVWFESNKFQRNTQYTVPSPVHNVCSLPLHFRFSSSGTSKGARSPCDMVTLHLLSLSFFFNDDLFSFSEARPYNHFLFHFHYPMSTSRVKLNKTKLELSSCD